MTDQTRNFVATIKEAADGRPFLLFEGYEDLGFEGKQLTLTLPEGASYDDARELAKALNSSGGLMKLASS